MLLRTAQSGGNDDEAIEFNGPISNLPFQIMVLVSLTLITFSFSPSTCSSSYIPLPSPLLLLLPPLQSSCSLSFLPTLSRIYRRWAWYCWWLSLVHKSWQSLHFQLLLTVWNRINLSKTYSVCFIFSKEIGTKRQEFSTPLCLESLLLLNCVLTFFICNLSIWLASFLPCSILPCINFYLDTLQCIWGKLGKDISRGWSSIICQAVSEISQTWSTLLKKKKRTKERRKKGNPVRYLPLYPFQAEKLLSKLRNLKFVRFEVFGYCYLDSK